MTNIIFQIIYFLLPVYFSNMGAVASAKIWRRWKTPIIKESVTLRGKPVLGKNKTWRGLVVGTLIGVMVYLIQSRFITGLEIHDYSSLTLGFLLAFGAVFGDLVKSFIKRQVGIPNGAKFIPFDQIDHPLMAMLLSLFIIDLSLQFFLIALALTFVLHILVNFISYSIKMRDTLW